MSGRGMSIEAMAARYGRQSLAESVAAVRQQVEAGGIQSPSIKALLAYVDLVLADEADWKQRAELAETALRELLRFTSSTREFDEPVRRIINDALAAVPEEPT